MNKEELFNLEREVIGSVKRLDDACESMWPIGSRVEVRLNTRQRTLSHGTVIDWWKGYARVRLDSINRRGKHTVRSVYFKEVQS
jgi:hypothetical protein